MCKVIPFMELMKGVSFIFDINLPKLEVFAKYSKTIKVVLPSQSLTNYQKEQNILLLGVIIYEDLDKEDYSYMLY